MLIISNDSDDIAYIIQAISYSIHTQLNSNWNKFYWNTFEDFHSHSLVGQKRVEYFHTSKLNQSYYYPHINYYVLGILNHKLNNLFHLYVLFPIQNIEILVSPHRFDLVHFLFASSPTNPLSRPDYRQTLYFLHLIKDFNDENASFIWSSAIKP